MSDAPGLHINTGEIKDRLGELGDNFSYASSQLKVIGARAVNRTVSHMRTVISKELRKKYYVQKRDLDASITIVKANPKKAMRGDLRYRDNMSLPLISFGAKQNKNYVSVRVLKANKMRRIQAGGERKILETDKKKRAAVWIAKGQVMARTEDADHPVMLWGPSFMSFFYQPSVGEQLRAESEAFLQKRLEHEATAMIKGFGKSNFGNR